jgi:peptidoglycan-N-acetylglucosamine deacetylase
MNSRWMVGTLIAALALGAGAACVNTEPLVEKQTQTIRRSFKVNGGPGSPEEVQERLAAKYRGIYYIEGLHHTKRIALTFDDGPSRHTSDLLAVLDRHGVKATFFLVGQRVEEYPAIARAVLAAGHTVANHSYSHVSLAYLSEGDFWDGEVGKTQEVLNTVLGVKPSFFRPPFGSLRDPGVEMLASRGLKVIIWSVDTKDWFLARSPDTAAAAIERTVLEYVHDEAIVLMHDGGAPADKTVEAVDRLIPQLKARGYRFVTIDALIQVKPYQ